MDYLKEFISKLSNLDRSRNNLTVFKDFLTLSTYSLAQPIYRSEELEQKYLETIRKYTKEQAEEFSQLLAFLIGALTEKHQDFLGQVYMGLNLGNNATGQFFTPYHVSKMMSEICFTDVEKRTAAEGDRETRARLMRGARLEEKDFITLSEPCCGSGGMIIAYAETLKEHGYNYQNQLFVEAIDIDEMCFMMAFIQLSLYGIQARVMLGDTIAWKFSKVIYTPFYFLKGFEWKLKQLEEKSKIGLSELQLVNLIEPMQLNLCLNVSHSDVGTSDNKNKEEKQNEILNTSK